MKSKTKFLASVMLLLALLLTIPALAATMDGYTEVSTAEELVSALIGDAAKIRLTQNIDTTAQTTDRFQIDRTLELDLNNFTWTAKAPSEGDYGMLYLTGSGDLTVKNGAISLGTGGSVAIWMYSEGTALELQGVTLNGSIANIKGTVRAITSCNISLSVANGGGTGALVVGAGNHSSSGSVGLIQNSTISGNGTNVCGISLFSGTISSIADCTISSDGGWGMNLVDATVIELLRTSVTGGISYGTIGSVHLTAEDTIDVMNHVTITGGSDGWGISNSGKIGTITDCHISANLDAICNNGAITTISGCTLLASGTYGKSIENGSGATIGTVSGCTLTATQSSLHNHPGASIKTVTSNTINTRVANGGTITSLSSNTFTIPESDAINNTGWGEGKQGTITTCENNTFAEESPAVYTMKFARQIRLYEPWGVRVSMMVDLNGSAIALQNNSNVKSVGIYFLQGGTAPGQETMAASGTLVASEFNAALSSSQDVYSSDFVGIQTSKLAETIYYMGALTLADGTTVYSDVREMSVLELLQAGVSNASMSTEEKNVYQAIINWYDAYQTYLNN